MSDQPVYSGHCLCGAVRLRVTGPLTPAHACHCEQCRRQSGNFVVGAEAPRADVAIEGEENLAWFESSPGIRRGFCRHCGSHLFWDNGAETLSFNLGCLDQPTGLRIAEHIFVDEKADYTEIADDLPKFAGYDRPLSA